MEITKHLMGMHVTVEVKDGNELHGCNLVFEYLDYIDQTFSTYKTNSEISKINRGQLLKSEYSADMVEVFNLAEQTKQETRGYFDIKKADGKLDPSGIVKGWGIWKAGLLLKQKGYQYFFIDAGGDVQTSVPNSVQKSTEQRSWTVGIRNPFNVEEIIKVLKITNQGVATSGTYERGQHIYNPHDLNQPIKEIVSLTVIGPNIYEADRYVTAAFAMSKDGINFIETIKDLEGYAINDKGIATMTSGFEKYVTN